LKSLMLLLQMMLADASIRCHTSTTLDYNYVERRVEAEGESFLTISLPAFANDFQKALAEEAVTPSLFAGFRKRGKLPIFLGGLLELVFDRWSGRLLDAPSIAAVQTIRQVTLAFGKIRKDCSDERIQAAYKAYIECELDVKRGDRARSPDDLMDYGRVSRLLWRRVNSRLDRRIYDGELIPRHGPGQTADRLVGNQKFTLEEWTTRMQGLFPYEDIVCVSNDERQFVLDRVDFREPARERPVKVTHVAKTLKTPRIIAMEPTSNMYVQLGIMDMMKEEFRADENARNLICFDSQEPNQLLARSASRDGRLATLDLKEASDRVSNQLVRELFANHPHLGEAVQVVRSRTADVPYHGVIRLAKYASMGSGLTFPLESMVFCTLVFLGIERALKRPLTQNDVTRLYGSVRVYGDDTIVPVEYVESVIQTLEAFGALVNRNKSFWTGKFRESCGGDYYDGFPVNVVRLKHEPIESRRDGSEVSSFVAFRNHLYEIGGYDRTVAWCDARIKRVLRTYPYVKKGSPALGRWHHSGQYTTQKMHGDEQRPLVRAWVTKPRVPVNSIDGYAALRKTLIRKTIVLPQKLADEIDAFDERHLELSGRPRVVDIKLGWTSPV
jgi:hypothetical protein